MGNKITRCVPGVDVLVGVGVDDGVEVGVDVGDGVEVAVGVDLHCASTCRVRESWLFVSSLSRTMFCSSITPV